MLDKVPNMEKTCLMHFEGFVCVYVCVSVCMYIFLYVWLYVCVCVHMSRWVSRGICVGQRITIVVGPHLPLWSRLGLFVIYICVADIRQAGWRTWRLLLSPPLISPWKHWGYRRVSYHTRLYVGLGYPILGPPAYMTNDFPTEPGPQPLKRFFLFVWQWSWKSLRAAYS